MLRINYLCGRITNPCRALPKQVQVVICSELTTFAVESPTFNKGFAINKSCDLLRINYLCGRITNRRHHGRMQKVVVICSELTTFAVESPTLRQSGRSKNRCDLLRINYLCGRITNGADRRPPNPIVVICSELTTFAVESPTVQCCR